MVGKLQNFSLNEMVREIVRPGFSRSAIRTENSLTTINWLEPGYRSTGQHSHPFDQLSYVLSGTMRFFIGEEVLDVKSPGAVYIPGGVLHGGEPVGDEVVLNIDVFAPVREDYQQLCIHQSGFDQLQVMS